MEHGAHGTVNNNSNSKRPKQLNSNGCFEFLPFYISIETYRCVRYEELRSSDEEFANNFRLRWEFHEDVVEMKSATVLANGVIRKSVCCVHEKLCTKWMKTCVCDACRTFR